MPSLPARPPCLRVPHDCVSRSPQQPAHARDGHDPLLTCVYVHPEEILAQSVARSHGWLPQSLGVLSQRHRQSSHSSLARVRLSPNPPTLSRSPLAPHRSPPLAAACCTPSPHSCAV